MNQWFPAAAVILGASYALASMQQESPSKIGLSPEQRDILDHISVVYLDDGTGNQVKTLRFTGVNVQIVNGLGSTETTNGAGNLIVGYQEVGNEVEADLRTGSHNFVGGRSNNYTAFGGLVLGESNRIHGPYCSVGGGRLNGATASWSSVGGGAHNTATAFGAVVTGGSFNWAGADCAVVVGGEGNRAIPPGHAGAGAKAVVVGGYDNSSRGQGSVIVGGRYNDTTANYSAILAGAGNTCIGDPQGGGSYCSISGGEGNSTSNVMAAAVGGGMNRSAAGAYDWVGGNLRQDN
jgi:hypothetical protein